MEVANKRRITHYLITIFITSVFVMLAIIEFDRSYVRFWESLTDLYISMKFYFYSLFKIDTYIKPTITEYSKIFVPDRTISIDYDVVRKRITDYFALLFSSDNLANWTFNVLEFLGELGKVITISIPIVIILYSLIRQVYKGVNNSYNVDTLPLKILKRLTKAIYCPIKSFFIDFCRFITEHKEIGISWIIIWMLSLNIASIVIEFFAYYLYFTMSYQLETIYIQIAKLIIDLSVPISMLPWYVLLPLGVYILSRIRERIATNKLRHMEARNCGFIKDLPIVSMTCGSMGKKKTTVITDMALSQEVMFRQKAFEILQNNDMKFPFFPWMTFELELQACMRHRTVYNLATVKQWVELKRCRYDKHNDSSLQLYGYDVKKHGTTYDDDLKVTNLFDVLSTYAQAYFIYVIESSLLVTNYSIREDNVILSEGNFPIWNTNFFPKRYRRNSKHAHILDFDVLRLGKKVIDENPKIGSFEFGVVVITEIGKERGNNLELKEVKKGTIETNQKNDLFNSWLKMCRHSATVDNYPFIKVFTDEQRPESWGADARDLADIVTIVKSGESKIALPFFTLEEMLYEWTFNRFINLYYDFRYRRGDNTLLVYVLKQFVSGLYKHYTRLNNRFGYSTLLVVKERGVMDGKQDKNRYFLMNKKIYSSRFSTDCFSDYFNDMAKKTKVGINDYIEYATEKASVEELKSQNSYFINALYKDADDN